MSDIKTHKKRGLSEYVTSEDGLVARLSNKIESLSEEIDEKSSKLSEITSELFTWKQKCNELSMKYDRCQEK